MKVLICGCERSGTTIIAKLLAKASDLKLLNDPKESWYIYPLVRVMGIKSMPISFILKLWKSDIVKVPGFATILPELKKINLRNFKVIYLVRDPRDNYAAIKERLAEDLNGLFLNINFLNLKGNSQAENIALRWNSYLDSALSYHQDNGNVYFLKYEDFLDDKMNKINEIAEFCGTRFQSEKIINDLDNQINKSWSDKIYGEGRYKSELEVNEIETIVRITKKNMEIFNYLE